MGAVNGSRVVTAAAAIVLAGTFFGGHVLGRAGPGDDPAAAEPVPPGAVPPADAAPPSGGPPEAPASPAWSEADRPEPEPSEAEPSGTEPDEVRAARPAGPREAAATQPFTGPGRPPLPRSRGGPYGSRPTTGGEYVALTFDDGPDPRWTPEVLALLREYEVTATFCVVGELARAHPGLVRDIAEAGHTLCNHTWNHDMGLGSRSRSEVRRDLRRTTAAIQEAAPGARVSYYRQPGGVWTERVVDVAEDLGMSSLHWAVDPRDWARPGAATIADSVTSGTTDGAIVLLHDGGGDRQGTVSALRTILPDLAGRFRLAGLPPGIDPPLRHGVELPAKPSQL